MPATTIPLDNAGMFRLGSLEATHDRRRSFLKAP
jgi:hypothetical protein